MLKYLIIPLLFLVPIVEGSSGDDVVLIDSTQSDTLIYQPEDISAGMAAITDSVNYESRLIQPPTKALFKSMVVPGWGQYGNRRKIKATAMFALDVYLVSKAIKHGGDASDFKDQYNNTPIDDLTTRRTLYQLYEDSRTQRSKFTWFAVILSFFSMFDAFVDAHLSGVPTEDRPEKLSFDIVPDESVGAKAVVSFSF